MREKIKINSKFFSGLSFRAFPSISKAFEKMAAITYLNNFANFKSFLINYLEDKETHRKSFDFCGAAWLSNEILISEIAIKISFL